MNNLIILQNLVVIPELFLGICIVYLLLYSSIVSTHRTYPLIQNLLLKLVVLSLVFCMFLLYNDSFLLNDVNLFFTDSFILDYLSFFAKITIIIFSLFCIIMIQYYIKDQKLNQFEYLIIILISILGFLLLCSANDFLTAYLAIELQSLSFYIMAAFKKNSSFSVEAGLKYFVLGSFSSALLLLGISFLYGVLGTFNFGDINSLFYSISRGPIGEVTFINFNDVNEETLKTGMFDPAYNFFIVGSDMGEFPYFDPSLVLFSLVLVLISLFFKLAVAPLHVWSPDVYENSPTSSTIFFAVISKLSILVLLIRIFNISNLYGYFYNWRYFIVGLAVLSVIAGTFAALEQRKLKSLLAYSSVSHIGYILIAFSTGTIEGIQSLYLYIIIYMLAGLCVWSIFLLLRIKTLYKKKSNKDLTDLTLLYKSNNIISFCFSIVLFSIAGFPPLIGFFAKLGIFLSAIETSMYFVAVIAILTSVISTFYYIRIIKIMYFEKVIVSHLFMPLNFIQSFIVVCSFLLLIYLFINPTLLYLLSYKLSLLSFI